MFLVFNKQKIFSYIIAFTTVIALLGMAKIYTNKSAEIVETFSKAREDKKQLEDKSQVIKQNTLVLSDNWNDSDVNQMLLLLKKYNVKMKFYMTDNWKNKHNASVNQIANYGHELLEIENE